MALQSRKNLTQMLGVSQAVITMAVKRGHLVADKNGYFDDQNQLNSYFIQKKLKGSAPQSNDSDNEEIEPRRNEDIAQLAALKTKIWIKKTNEEYEIARLKKEKIQGSVVPVDIIKTLLIMFSESVKVAWVDASEDMLIQVSAAHKLSRGEHGKLKAKLVDVVNRAVDHSVDDAKKSLRRIQGEFSDIKGRGEHS